MTAARCPRSLSDHEPTSGLDDLSASIRLAQAALTNLEQDHVTPLERKYDALKSATDELKTQLGIILSNINGMYERLDRLEQAHGDLERQVLDMLTNTLPSSTDRITQLEHHVQSEIDRLESRLNEQANG